MSRLIVIKARVANQKVSIDPLADIILQTKDGECAITPLLIMSPTSSECDVENGLYADQMKVNDVLPP